MNGKKEFANTDKLLVNGDNIKHMIVVPKGATNGDMIKAMFPDVVNSNMDLVDAFNNAKSWWNAPYKKEVEE